MKTEQDQANINQICNDLRHLTDKMWFPVMQTPEGKEAFRNLMAGFEEQVKIFELAGEAMV